MSSIPEGAVKVFKYVTKDFLSIAKFSKIDYSGPYPKKITEKNCAPKEAGKHAPGIHVIPMIDDIDWINVIFSSEIIVGYVMPEDIVFSEGNGTMRVKTFTVTHIPQRDEIIPFILQSPEASYNHALLFDKEVKSDTRESILKCPYEAYECALSLDKSPRNDTRKACCLYSDVAYDYALNIDKAPHDDTRKGASIHDQYAYYYARDVDKSPHLETWESVKETLYQPDYIKLFKTTAKELNRMFAPKI